MTGLSSTNFRSHSTCPADLQLRSLSWQPGWRRRGWPSVLFTRTGLQLSGRRSCTMKCSTSAAFGPLGLGKRGSRVDCFDCHFTSVTVKHLDSVMVWGCFYTAVGWGGLYFLSNNCTMNGEHTRKSWPINSSPPWASPAPFIFCRIELPDTPSCGLRTTCQTSYSRSLTGLVTSWIESYQELLELHEWQTEGHEHQVCAQANLGVEDPLD